MSSKTIILLRKELRELARERVVLFGLLIGPIIMFLFMGAVGAAATQTLVHQVTAHPRIALDYQGGEPGNVTLLLARELGADVYTNAPPEELAGKGYEYIVLLNESFEESILRGEPATLTIIYNVRNPSLATLNRIQMIRGLLNNATLTVFAEILHEKLPTLNKNFFSSPVHPILLAYYNGRITPATQLAGLVFGLSLAVPLAILITAAAATQVSAISLALEKEAKTLEKILTLPVSRTQLVVGKLAAVTILALGGVISYLGGFALYSSLLARSLAGAPGNQLVTHVGITLEPGLLAVLGVGLSLTLYVAITVGFIAGSLADSVRSGQLAASYLTFILSLPIFIMFFGVSPASMSTAAKIAFLVDPYSTLAGSAMAAVAGDYALATAGLAILAGYSILLTLIARYIVSSEFLITGSERLRSLVSRLSKKTG